MSSIDNLAKDLYTIIHNKEEKGPKPYEPVAKVVKVEDDVVWVKIPGSETETPVEKTINAEIGDRVRVRLSGGRAWVIGNMTVPPTGDTVAKQAMLIAKGASDHARKAIEKIEEMGEFTPGEFGIVCIWYEYNMSTSNAEFIQAQGYDWSEEIPEFNSNYFIWKRTVYEYADGEVVYGDPEFSSQDQALAEVKLAQDSTNNHFWHNNSGAYVTEEDGTYATGYATRITNAGILQSYDNKLMSSWTNSGIVFYKSDGQTPYVTYGANGITFDSSTGFQIGNNSTYLKWVKEGNTWKLRLQVDSLTIGGDPVLTEQDRLEITSITYAYALSTSGTQIPTSGWQSTPVAPTTTQYAWTRTTVTYSDGHTAVSYTVGGKTGQNGTNGTSVTITSTSVKYASQSASATGAGTTPPSSGWSTSVPSVAAGNYLWSRTIVTYSNNTSTTSYAVARNGMNGSDITSQYLSWNTTGGLTLGYNNVIQSKLNLKGDGVRIYNGAGNLGAKLHAEGMTVYDGTATTESEATEVASFGAATRIGKSSTRHIEILDGGLKVYQNASTELAHLGYGLGNKLISGTEDAPYYTLGTRRSSTGESNTGEGDTSESGTSESDTSIGNYSLVEGRSNSASGYAAHAEGFNTSATGGGSHAEGGYTEATELYSHAGGYYTKACGNVQTVIGKFNKTDSTSLFIVGNGESDTSRTNALEVGSDGNLNITGSYKKNDKALLVTESKALDNVSISASDFYSNSYSVAKTGYTPIGVVGFDINNATSSGSGSSNANIIRCSISGSSVYWQVRNISSSSSIKIKLIAYILYMAT